MFNKSVKRSIKKINDKGTIKTSLKSPNVWTFISKTYPIQNKKGIPVPGREQTPDTGYIKQ